MHENTSRGSKGHRVLNPGCCMRNRGETIQRGADFALHECVGVMAGQNTASDVGEGAKWGGKSNRQMTWAETPRNYMLAPQSIYTLLILLLHGIRPVTVKMWSTHHTP
jgi:hypothetical protein